jgi:hypothetical protein
MVKVNIFIVIIAIGVVFFVYRLFQGFYFLDKYSNPDSDEERVQGFLYFFLPELHCGSHEDFYYFLRLVFMIIFVLALLYALLFKMPIPFVGKPLLVIVG